MALVDVLMTKTSPMTVRIHCANTTFAIKDTLKARGYRLHVTRGSLGTPSEMPEWVLTIPADNRAAMAAEAAWLKSGHHTLHFGAPLAQEPELHNG